MHQAGESAAEMAARKRRLAAEKRADAERLDREADGWEQGSEGERQVGAALEAGRAHGWVVLHDVRWPGRPKANIDHVAVGPGGVLVVDAKNWSGSVTVRDGVLRQGGFRRNREVEGASEAATAVAGQLNLPWSLHVIPLLALAGQPTAAAQRVGAVTVVGVGELTGWMASLPPQLAPADVIGLSTHLAASLSRDSAFSPQRTVIGPISYGTHPLATARRPLPTHSTPRRSGGGGRRRDERRAAARRRELRKMLFALAFLSFLLLGGWPLFIKATEGAGSLATREIVPTPSIAPSAAARAFASCRALNASFPHGVGKPGAANRGPATSGLARVDAAAYARNARLDTDHDGLACER